MVNNLLTKHLKKNDKLMGLLGGRNIFYLEKPFELKVEQFIVIKDKLLGHEYIEEYQIQIDVISKDIRKVVAIEKELREYLNDVKGQKLNTGFRLIKVLNGGGTVKDDEDNWIKVIYFLCKI